VYVHFLIKRITENGDSRYGIGLSIAAICSAFLEGEEEWVLWWW
jgi:hypothetical protein